MITLRLLALLTSFVCVTRAANAEQIFVDTFNYPPGALAGKGPPPGSPAGQKAWTNYSGDPQVTVGGLSYLNVAPDVNKATVAGGGVDLALGDDAIAQVSPVGGVGGGVVWVGFFINQKSGGPDPGGFAVVSVGTASTNIGIGVLDHENVYGIDNNVESPVEQARTSVAAGTAVTWLVTKLDFDAGMEYIFVNPSREAEPPNSAAAAAQPMPSVFQAAGIDEVILAAGSNEASFSMDELRLGTEFTEVLPTATVFLKAPVSRVTAGSGDAGIFTLTREGGSLSQKLKVDYAVMGDAVPGVDYEALSGTATIKPGKKSVNVLVDPKGDLKQGSAVTVKLKLRRESDYAVGTTASKQVEIVAGP